MGNKDAEKAVKKIKLHIPEFEELWFRQKLYSDQKTMDYGDKPIDFSIDKWKSWYEKWIKNPKDRFYAYLVEGDRFVGDVNFHYDENFDCFMLGVVVLGEERNKGFAQQGLKLLCEKAKEVGLKKLCNLVPESRKSAIHIHEKLGFVKLCDKSSQFDVFLEKRF